MAPWPAAAASRVSASPTHTCSAPEINLLGTGSTVSINVGLSPDRGRRLSSGRGAYAERPSPWEPS